MKNVSWNEAGRCADRLMLACKPHLQGKIRSPLKDIYGNNLPGLLKDVVYYSSVYGTPVCCAMDFVVVIDACKILDEKGFLELEVGNV